MSRKRISIAALCDVQPRSLPTPSDSGSIPPSSARRPSDSSSDASASGSSVAPFLHGSPPPRSSSAAYDPIRDADNRHDDPQSSRPISSLSPTTPPPPSAHIRKRPLAPAQHTSGTHFTPIAPRPDPTSTSGSVRNSSTSPPNPPSPPNAPSARPAQQQQQQQQTRHLAILPSPRFTPYPPHLSIHTLPYSTQFAPSTRTDLRSNNGPIAFEFYVHGAAGSSSSRRGSKSKPNRTSPSSSSVGKPGSTNMSANPKKSKSKSKVAVVGREEASNTSGRGVLGSNTRGEPIPNAAACSTSPSASGSGSGGRPPTPGAASNANSSTMGDALDVEMELLNALGGEEETRAESASLGARGPVKVETQTTTAEDDLLEEVEAMERASTHKPARPTPFMSSPMKLEPEEGGAMEVDLKRPTLSPSPALLQLPPRTSPRTAPTPIPISAPHSQPTSASHSLRPTPSPARTPTMTPANLPTPLPPAAPTASTKKGPSKTTGGAAKASAATSKGRAAKATAAKRKQIHPSAHELLKVGNTKSKGGGGGPSSSAAPGAGGGGSFAFHGTSSGRAAAAAATASFGAALDAEDGYEDQRDGPEYRPDGPANAKGPGGAEEESEEEVDMRLYCVCRQLYDDRFMLGCENCDDWFHPNCIGLEEYQCELLEHFYCEPCQRADPNLKIVWRHRCANGVRHPAPDSSDACWHAAHPPMSKYCSKECGIEAVERRLLPFAKQKAGLRLEADERDEGVKREMKRLFAGMRERKRREAVVLRVDDGSGAGVEANREPGTTDAIAGASNRDRDKGLVIPPGMVVQSPASRLASDLAALQHDLAEALGELQMRTRELSFILARARLVKLAVSWSDKPENAQRCCFDSRMLMDGGDWEEWVEGEGRVVLLEGVTEDGPGGSAAAPPPPVVPRPATTVMVTVTAAATATATATAADGREVRLNQEVRTTPPEGEESGLEDEMGVEDEDSPWCDGRRKCERHAGWQKLQVAECDLNRGIKELIISRLKERAEHLRIRIKCVHTALESSQQGRKTAEKDSDSVMLDVV